MNEEFEAEWGRGKGIMHTTCSIPQNNVLNCEREERAREWKLTSRYAFSKFGVINTLTFYNAGVTAKKYYQVV